MNQTKLKDFLDEKVNKLKINFNFIESDPYSE